MERNIKLIIEYDGTRYAGWQYQKNALTVQQVIEEAITKLTKQYTPVIGSGRTDSGVHALGQVANFKTYSSIPTHRWPYALNAILPEDIRIKDAQEVDLAFNARFDAKGKLYKYDIWNAPYASAILRHFCLHIAKPLDLDAMQKAGQYIIGTHDFSAFQATGSTVRDSLRTIWRLDIHKKDHMVSIFIAGNGFLYNMVRIISGTLIEIGMGKRAPQEMEVILNSRDRKRAGKTAPPHGLCLMEVYY